MSGPQGIQLVLPSVNVHAKALDHIFVPDGGNAATSTIALLTSRRTPHVFVHALQIPRSPDYPVREFGRQEAETRLLAFVRLSEFGVEDDFLPRSRGDSMRGIQKTENTRILGQKRPYKRPSPTPR